MTPQELFDMLMVYPQPTRTEILNHIEEITRNYEPERVEALLADFADMLPGWKIKAAISMAEALNALEVSKFERYKKELEEYQAAQDETSKMRRYEEILAISIPTECSKKPTPVDEPQTFITPAPWELDVDNVEIPELYNYAVERLESHLDKSRNEYKSGIYESVIFSESQQIIISKAIAAGFMEPTPTGYKWLYGGSKSKVRLAYFLMSLFNDEVPNKEMERVFNVKRIDRSLDQARTQEKQDWADRIEELFP